MKRCNCEHPLPPPQPGPSQHTGSRLYPCMGPHPMPFHPIPPVCPTPIPEPWPVSSSTDQLWTGFAGKEFGAARAYADQDGNNIKATYATKKDLDSALGDVESLLAAL